MSQNAKWKDGTPKSQGNAFDWHGSPSVFEGGRFKTLRQILLDANRVNMETSLGEHGQADRSKRISMASI